MNRIAAVIPSAGLSSRMGRFKPLLPLGKKTVLERCIASFLEAGVNDVVVVTGKRSHEVAEVACRAGAEAVHNPHYEQGMFSSVVAGVRALTASISGFFVLPVDIPLVRPETIKQLMAAFHESRPQVVYPVFHDQPGHPPCIRHDLVGEILEHDGDGGLRAVLERYEADSLKVPVADFGTMHDLDHPADYAKALSLAATAGPSEEECTALWDIHETPAETVAHCRAVAAVAVAFCERLNGRGHGQLDLQLVQGAALSHDLAKGMKYHDKAGAEFLRLHGFHEAAAIVAAHTDLSLDPQEPITEREAVFLADKVVRGSDAVPLQKRYQEKLDRFAHDEAVRAKILERLERAEIVALRFTEAMGVAPESVALEVLG